MATLAQFTGPKTSTIVGAISLGGTVSYTPSVSVEVSISWGLASSSAGGAALNVDGVPVAYNGGQNLTASGVSTFYVGAGQTLTVSITNPGSPPASSGGAVISSVTLGN